MIAQLRRGGPNLPPTVLDSGVPRGTAERVGSGYRRSDTAAIAALTSRKANPMLRPNIRLALGGVAAVAVGIVGGWTLLAARPVQASSPAVETARIPVTTASSSADEAAPPTRAPAQTAAQKPTPAAPPARTAEAPPPAPPAPAPDAAPADDTRNKPRIHLDGERSELSFDGDKGSLHINKDKLSVRTPLGKFEIDW